MIRYTRNYLAALSLILLFSAFIVPVSAAENAPLLERNLFSIGAGISDNSISNDDETGFQIFVAYDLNQIKLMEGVTSSVEFGFMDYGFKRDNTGIWGTYTVDGVISGEFGWLGRLGLDIGDDSGLMVGAGVSYATNEKSEIRIEYVVRDEIDSLQLNFLFQL